jgi:hypothetical protein
MDLRTGISGGLWEKRIRIAVGIALLALMAMSLMPRPGRAQDDTASIAGDYSVVIGRNDVPRDLPNGPSLIGRWRITFAKDGTFVLERQDVGPVVTGSYEVNGSQVIITDEGGLLACTVGPDGETDVSSATYQWDLLGDRLTLFPVEDGCVTRRILLGTREFAPFVACLTGAAPAPVATPEPAAESPLSVLRGATPPTGPDGAIRQIEEQIDALLAQMTACWATGDPTKFLPLLSSSFLPEFKASLGAADATEAEFIALMTQAMSVPFVFERAGDIDIEDDTHVSAIVRTQIGGSEDFSRFRFVFEDGAWRWDGIE